MTTKEKLMSVAAELPPDATIADAMERLFVLAKIERGIAQADAGRTMSHAEASERLAKWQK